MASIQREIMELMINNAEALGLPKNIQMDYLPPNMDAIALQPDASPKVEKAYIGGSKVCTFPFTMLATTKGSKSSEPSIKAMDWLNAIGALFEGMSNFQLSTSRKILNGETMTPALVNRHQDGRLIYSISINIRYEDN